MLTVTFQSGETRIVNLHPAFHAEKKVTVSSRVLDFVADISRYAYKIVCTRGNVTVFEQTTQAFTPADYSAPRFKEDFKTKKELRREHKNNKFTQKWNFSTGLFTNLITKQSAVAPLQMAA